MIQLVNDEVKIPREVFGNRTPTQVLRLTEVSKGKVILEQWWAGNIHDLDPINIEGRWIPVSMADDKNNPFFTGSK